MAYKHEGDVYSGKTSDTLLVIEKLAKEMTEHDLREAELYMPFTDGHVTIRLKR